MAKGFYAAFSEQMDRLQSSVENIYNGAGTEDGTAKSVSLPTYSLVPGTYQPRRNFQDAELEELAESIRQQGLIQPIIVRPRNDGSYEILAGERRWRACKLVGKELVEVVIKDVDDQAALAMSLIENIQRENLNPIEEAEGYQRLIDDFGLKQSLVGQLVGKSRSRISRLLSLLSLPATARERISKGELSGAHGIVLAAQSLDEPEVDLFASLAIENQWSRDQLDRAIQDAKAPAEPEPEPVKVKKPTVEPPPAPSWFNEFRQEVDSLNEGSGWSIAAGFDHKSKLAELTIPFSVDSLEDFEDATHEIVNLLRRIRRNRFAN
jgi:ParB family chromosome partitioning protein